MERWRGRVAIVTGASAGIGEKIAIALAENHIKVVAVARRLERLQELCKTIKGTIYPLKCDIKNETDIINAIKWTKENLGSVDILVNNAGVSPVCPLNDFKTEDLKAIYDTNVFGLCIFTREVLKCMKECNINDGHIFHINSFTGQRILELPGLYPYSGSKHAVSILTEGLRRELRDAGKKIRVTSISPGIVNTDIFEASGSSEAETVAFLKENPHLEPKDIADALLYALGTPPHVQVVELTVIPLGEKV